MGNVREQTFSEMIGSEACKTFVAESLPVSEPCKTCRYAALCRGGCRRDREPFAGGAPQLNRYCEAYRAFFERCGADLEQIARAVAERGRR